MGPPKISRDLLVYKLKREEQSRDPWQTFVMEISSISISLLHFPTHTPQTTACERAATRVNLPKLLAEMR